jgi:hypothetical protein
MRPWSDMRPKGVKGDAAAAAAAAERKRQDEEMVTRLLLLGLKSDHEHLSGDDNPHRACVSAVSGHIYSSMRTYTYEDTYIAAAAHLECSTCPVISSFPGVTIVWPQVTSVCGLKLLVYVCGLVLHTLVQIT